MNCKRIQEIIMTDYLDGEASLPLQDQIKEHIASCAQCRAFEQNVRRNAQHLFKDISPVQPPDAVWHRIKEAINEGQTRNAPSFLERFLDSLRESFIVRRPAYAFAAAFTIILMVVVFMGSPFRQQMLVKDYLSRKSAFMLAMNSAPNGELDNAANFNTAIEEYLF
ncbi:MAG: zf-HC2 domain-containing protein [Candidatus Omnitrophota bacterium]